MRCCPGAKYFPASWIRAIAIAAGAGISIGCLANEATEPNGGGAVGPRPVASVSVTPATASLPVGATLQLAAVPEDSAGGALTGRPVTWASSDIDVASVSTSGRVTAGAAGSATVTATSEGKAGSATVTVTLIPVAAVVVSPATAALPVGGTAQLTVTLSDANDNTLTGRPVAWSTSAPTVATVSRSGLVTGKAAGSATITATSEGKTGSAAVTVTLVPVASVVVSPATLTLPVGSAAQLIVTLKDASGRTLTGRPVAWTSSAPTVATV